jgi:hypothetical protein
MFLRRLGRCPFENPDDLTILSWEVGWNEPAARSREPLWTWHSGNLCLWAVKPGLDLTEWQGTRNRSRVSPKIWVDETNFEWFAHIGGLLQGYSPGISPYRDTVQLAGLFSHLSFNTTHHGWYCPYSLVRDPQNFLNWKKLWKLVHPWADRRVWEVIRKLNPGCKTRRYWLRSGTKTWSKSVNRS